MIPSKEEFGPPLTDREISRTDLTKAYVRQYTSWQVDAMLKELKDKYEQAKKYMSHTQKCQFKFGPCGCGYQQFMEESGE